MDRSRNRQRARSIYERIGKQVDKGLGRSAIFAGSVYTHKVRCGKPECRCAQEDYRHEMICVSFVEEGQSRTRVIPEGEQVEMRRMTQEYKQVRKARRQMKELFEELLSELDKLIEARCAEGRSRFERAVLDTRKRAKKGEI